MRKWGLRIGLPLVLLAVLLGSWGWWHHQAKQVATVPVRTHTEKVKPVSALTIAELKRQPKRLYAAVIYYAVKHVNIQRWQEVSDFKQGWEVELDLVGGQTHYSVWPNQAIQESEKRLEPNWFTLKQGRVTYHSFVVHSDGDYQTHTVALTRIVRQVNADRAAKRIRHMPTRMRVLKVKNATIAK